VTGRRLRPGRVDRLLREASGRAVSARGGAAAVGPAAAHGWTRRPRRRDGGVSLPAAPGASAGAGGGPGLVLAPRPGAPPLVPASPSSPTRSSREPLPPCPHASCAGRGDGVRAGHGRRGRPSAPLPRRVAGAGRGARPARRPGRSGLGPAGAPGAGRSPGRAGGASRPRTTRACRPCADVLSPDRVAALLDGGVACASRSTRRPACPCVSRRASRRTCAFRLTSLRPVARRRDGERPVSGGGRRGGSGWTRS